MAHTVLMKQYTTDKHPVNVQLVPTRTQGGHVSVMNSLEKCSALSSNVDAIGRT